MKKVEKYIEKAIKQVEDNLKQDNNKVLNVYNGYISSMGASIIQSGLLPTLAAFESTKKDGKAGDKMQIIKSILNIIKIDAGDSSNETSLLKYVMSKPEKTEYYKEKIINIGIALKLAIRTFELE